MTGNDKPARAPRRTPPTRAKRSTPTKAAAAATRAAVNNLDHPSGYAVTVKNQAVWWYVQGFSVAQILGKFEAAMPPVPVTRSTVQGWLDDAMRDIRVPPDEVDKARSRVVARLDAAAQVATEMMHEWAGSEMGLKAIDRLVRVEDRRAKLLGLDVPVRHDITLHERTQADIELEEMINEARAKTALAEAQVIAEASADEAL